MHDEDTELSTRPPRLTPVQQLHADRIRRRRRRLQMLGGALVLYGIIGVAIFIVVAGAINQPLERVRQLSASVEQQRAALVDSLEQAHTTIQEMSEGVGRMDTSLSDARSATDRSAGIATNVASSMFQLRDAMSIEIPLVGQPLIGLAAGFEQTGTQLEALAGDLRTIGTSLETNRVDIATTAANMQELATSVESLTDTVRTGSGLEITESALDSFRYALFAVAGWLLVFALGCVVAGGYLVWSARRAD